ncbi:MAG: chemotaxis protein CheA [Acidobacteria bacterium]|nr:MAG: chemotaxis protein CheA [Acidobacteriota bacterium]PYY08998.1 MAG: chemotaxis protein CheA [Acidobacteriota bacterium]
MSAAVSSADTPCDTVATPRRSLRRWPFEFAFREERFFLVLSVFIGIFSALAVVCFRLAIDWSRLWLLGPRLSPSGLRVILAPSLAGIVVAILVLHAFPTVRGSGVNQTKAALYIYNGYIPLRTGVGKFITSAWAIGAGHSLGPEDPSLQIGASLASALGRRLKLSREKLRLLAPVGAAAGLAAAFNAPISAVLFVIEEVIGRWSAGILGSVVLSAVSSVVVMRWFLGSEPMFRIPAVQLIRPQELLAYAALGIVGGFAAVIFARGIGFLRPRLKVLPRWTQYLQPGIAGLMIGLIGYVGFPQVMGAGYEYIDEAMHGQFTWKTLAMLAALKILATTLSFVSGTPGGMFAPTLFIGAMLGGAVGHVERIVFPYLTGSVGTYCLVGMGVLFAGFLRAPMTSVFMVLEVSGNYSIIVPVIVANTLAYVVSRALEPTPIFDLLTRQDGLELPSLEEQREETILRVEDAMHAPVGPVLDSDETVEHVNQRVQLSSANIFLVHLSPGGWTTVTRDTVARLKGEGKGELSLGTALPSQRLPCLHPDLPLEAALRHIHESPLLPVVHRADFGRLEGVISQQDVLNRYKLVEREA